MKMKILALLLLMASVCAAPMFPGGGGSGVTSCPASGSLALSTTSTFAVIVSVQAPAANAGTLHVGIGTISSTTGIALVAGSSYTWASRGNTAAYNLSQINFVCSNSADTISYTYAN